MPAKNTSGDTHVRPRAVPQAYANAVDLITSVTHTENEILAEEMCEFYDIRSKVVHGAEVCIETDFVDSVEDYSRESIHLFHQGSRAASQAHITDHLDLD